LSAGRLGPRRYRGSFTMRGAGVGLGRRGGLPLPCIEPTSPNLLGAGLVPPFTYRVHRCSSVAESFWRPSMVWKQEHRLESLCHRRGPGGVILGLHLRFQGAGLAHSGHAPQRPRRPRRGEWGKHGGRTGQAPVPAPQSPALANALATPRGPTP